MTDFFSSFYLFSSQHIDFPRLMRVISVSTSSCQFDLFLELLFVFFIYLIKENEFLKIESILMCLYTEDFLVYINK